MSRIHGRHAPSGLALLIAAGLAAPAFAADTTTTIAAGATQATAVTASPAAPDTYTLNILGTLRQGGAGNVTNVSIQGSGSGMVVINNDGRLQGRFNFPSATGSITLHNNTGDDPLTNGWHTGGVTTLGGGADLIDNAAGGTIAATASTTFAFGAGADRFVNAGRLITERTAGSGFSSVAGTLTLTGLEVFENSGLILLGSAYSAEGNDGVVSDSQFNDRLIALGTAFTGSDDSRIAMDVSLTALTQTGCPATPTAADCIDFTGGSTAGSTLLTIHDVSNNADGGALNTGITLIAGSSAAGDFTLSPDSDYYVADTSLGPAMQKRLIAYHVEYDAANDRHQLVGLPADEAFESATFAASAQETWRATAGSWLTRQADLRAAPGGLEAPGGLWGRLGASVSERDGEAAFTQGGETYDYDLSYRQRIAHAVFGADLLGAAGADSAWVVGGMVGFVRGDVDFDAAPTETVSTGFTGGLYASYVAGPLFVDGLVNVNLLHMRAHVPNMSLDIGVPLKQDLKSLGGQLEAGWRFDVGGGVFIEPLAGVSYVTTKMEDMDVPGGGGSFDFEDKYTSLRAGGGVRLGADSQLMGMSAGYSLTGRYWTDSEAENGVAVVVATGSPAIPLSDDFGGGFSEIAGGVSLYSDDGAVSGFLNLGGKFADDYRSLDASVGVRVRW